jgi:hypothetical protein
LRNDKKLNDEVKKNFELEMSKAAKEEIWKKAETLEKSMVKFGL